MAIEIIGEDESQSFKTSCPGCGAVLRYFEVDIKEGEESDYTGDKNTYRYIECPRCKREIRKGWADR